MLRTHGNTAAMLAAVAALSASAASAATTAAARANAPVPTRDVYSDTWVATDGLGRALPTGDSAGPRRPNKTVAIFYFIANRMPGYPVWDNTQLLEANPLSPAYGPLHADHWWGQPWLGYYQSDDPWVIHTHMQMLADAGVDVVVFDNTNGAPNTYPDVRDAVCQELEAMRANGEKTPQIAVFANVSSAQKVYDDFYSKGLYSDLWFRWNSKPLIMIHYDDESQISDQLKQFFTIRRSWAWTPSAWFGNGQDAWPWLDNYPQNYGWDSDPGKPEEMAVETAQHATTSIGRSSLGQREPPVDQYHLTPNTAQGLCFAQQFDRALAIDPALIFVTGWNEWTAMRFINAKPGKMAGENYPAGGSFFVDEYNEEFSRDIEPENGMLQDDYYYQLVSYVRRYKGARTLPPVTAKSIRIDGRFKPWTAVSPEYRDDIGDTVHRNHTGWSTLRYVNNTGRNDIVAAKVAYDAKNVYFYVRTASKLTPYTDKSWMQLYVNADQNYKTGWLGYDYAINCDPGSNTTSVERNVGGTYTWQRVASVPYKTLGNELEIAVPRSVLGIPKLPWSLDFKWTDNCIISNNPSVSDFTLNGDAAPDGRFNYRAKLGD